MGEMLIAGIITAAALFFLVRHYYRVFTGKKSACNCGTKKFTVQDGTLKEKNGCSGCCSSCQSTKKAE